MNATATYDRGILREPNALTRFLRTPKGYLSIVFVPLLVIAATGVGWDQAVPHLLFAVFAAAATEVVIVRRMNGVWIVPTSAILSGLIVAMVLGPDNAWLVTAAVGALATASKHFIRTSQGHIFNPAALALALSVPIFATDQSWWGAFGGMPWFWALALVAGGLFIAERTYKYQAIFAFGLVYFGLLTVVALVNPDGVAELFRDPFAQSAIFLAFFMLTDPPTSAGRPADQIWFGALVAVVSIVAQLQGMGQTYLLIGLLAGNAAWAFQRSVIAPFLRRRRNAT